MYLLKPSDRKQLRSTFLFSNIFFTLPICLRKFNRWYESFEDVSLLFISSIYFADLFYEVLSCYWVENYIVLKTRNMYRSLMNRNDIVRRSYVDTIWRLVLYHQMFPFLPFKICHIFLGKPHKLFEVGSMRAFETTKNFDRSHVLIEKIPNRKIALEVTDFGLFLIAD